MGLFNKSNKDMRIAENSDLGWLGSLEREDMHVSLRRSWMMKLTIKFKSEHISRLWMATHRAARFWNAPFATLLMGRIAFYLKILLSDMSSTPSESSHLLAEGPNTSSKGVRGVESNQNNLISVRFLRRQHKIYIPREDSDTEGWRARVVVMTLKEFALAVVPAIRYMLPWIV